MARWEGFELERRTAARLSTAGLVPVLNVRHHETNLEFDIYAFRPKKKSVSRVMVQCSVSKPKSEKMSALKGYVETFGLDAHAFVTSTSPDKDQVGLAKMQGTALLCEQPNGDGLFGSAALDGTCVVNVQTPLSIREQLIVSSLRGMSYLHNRVKGQARTSEYADRVQAVWYELECVCIEPDPFARLGNLYEIHERNKTLSADCALGEELAVKGGAKGRQ